MEREGQKVKALYFLFRDAAPISPTKLSTSPPESNKGKELQLCFVVKGEQIRVAKYGIWTGCSEPNEGQLIL